MKSMLELSPGNAKEVASPGTVLKLVQIKPNHAKNSDKSWEGHQLSVEIPPAGCTVSFASVFQPCNLLERPQAIGIDILQQQLYTRTTQQAVQVAMAAYNEVVGSVGRLQGLPNDPLQISESMSVVEFGGDESALLLVTQCDGRILLLPPEGVTGPADSEEDDESSGRLEGSSETTSDKSTASLAAQLLLTQILAAEGPLAAPVVMQGKDTPPKEVYLVWAESLDGIKVSPSLLLAFALLAVRREAAMFLRMATGFGFAQVGDYIASHFYLFRRKGHRLKCWECGVKKKAPCGKIARDDLPWCCHRRLGEWLPRLVASPTGPGESMAMRENGQCFLTLLPPREALESEDPLATQLRYTPRTADVVRLSDVLQDRPVHPRQALRKALHRLAPTCHLLWCKTPWITRTVERMKAGKGTAAASAHLWLEKTAFFKVPRCLQDETVELYGRPFEDLVEELLPDVEDAPILGGHNRQPRPSAASGGGGGRKTQRRTGASGGAGHLSVGASGSCSRASLAASQGSRELSNSLAFTTTAADAMPSRTVRRSEMHSSAFSGYVHPSSAKVVSLSSGVDRGSSSEIASFAHFQAEVDGCVLEERQWANTGQGRRRLNARAALRAAGHKDFGCDPSDPLPLERSRLGLGPADVQLGGRAPPNPGLLWGGSSSPLPLSSTSGESDENSMLPADNVAPVKSGVSRPAPLRVMVNATGEPMDFVATGDVPRMTQQLHGPRTVVSAPGGLHTQRFQRFGGADAGCHFRVVQKTAASANQDDPDYVPERFLQQGGGQQGDRVAEVAYLSRSFELPRTAEDSLNNNHSKKGWRKPRTARLQFWNHQIKAPTKRRKGSDDEGGSWHEVQASEIFPPRRDGFLGRTPKRSCRSSDDDDDSLPSRESRQGGDTAMQQLLHAVELVGRSR